MPAPSSPDAHPTEPAAKGTPGTPAPVLTAEDAVERIRAVGTDVREALADTIAALPGAPRRAADLGRLLALNRDVAGRTLRASEQADPLEVVHIVPGPEPLRAVARAAAAHGIAAAPLERLRRAADRLDALVRDVAGTRDALDAIVADRLPAVRERYVLASRQSVHKGMRQLKGVHADAWIGLAVAAPSARDDQRLDVAFVNAAVGIRRVRPGASARFAYRALAGADGEAEIPDVRRLDDCCAHAPASLQADPVPGGVHYVIRDDILGPSAPVDMVVLDTHLAAMRRWRDADDAPRRSSLYVDPALPVATLVFDVYLAPGAFDDAAPELVVHETGTAGVANVNDRARDADLVETIEHLQSLGRDPASSPPPEFPGHRRALVHAVEALPSRPALESLRGWRVRMQYPVPGWQVSVAFPRSTPPVAAR